jgi:type II secretory ATPase GspE/PulE/Tfp pilus assembly ATPase PilB-like protein
MTCEEVRARVDAHVKGELSEEEWQAICEHAKTCVECARLISRRALESELRKFLSTQPESDEYPLYPRDLREATDWAESAPIIRVGNTIIQQAILRNADELVIEPGSEQVTVRYKENGEWKDAMAVPKYVQAPLTVRFKHMADLDLLKAEPQEGRIPVRYTHEGTGTTECVVAVSTQPTDFGETIHARLKAG